jgi:hypothetical protein
MDEALAQWTESELAGLAFVVVALLLPLVLLVKWQRHGSDPISETRAEWYGGMLKALLVVIVGAVLTGVTYSSAAAGGGGTYVVFWGMMVFGGLAFLWRAARYFFRVKPHLDLLERMPVAVLEPGGATPNSTSNPARSRRGGIRYWLGVAALAYLVLTVVARVAHNTRDTSQYRMPTAALENAGAAARPTPTPGTYRPLPSLAWGYRDDFTDETIAPITDGNNVTTAVRNGRFSITLPEPGGYWAKELGSATDGRDACIRVEVASTSGAGAAALYVTADDGSYRWAYLIDPSRQEWRVDRYSMERDSYFTWVEARSFASLSLGSLQTVELCVESSRPTLIVNGRDVAAVAGVGLDPMAGSVQFAYGAYGSGFTIELAAAEVSKI